MSRIAVLLIMMFAYVSWADDVVDITDPDQLAALTGLQEKIDTVSAAVTNCVSSGKGHGDCLRDNKVLVLNFNEAVEWLFATYPKLETLDLVSFKTPDGGIISQSLSGIKAQARMRLSCA